MRKRIKLKDDDIMFAVHTSTNFSRSGILPITWESLEINTVNSKIKNLRKLKSQILQDYELGNDLEPIIKHLEILAVHQDKDYNQISLIPLINKLRKMMENEK